MGKKDKKSAEHKARVTAKASKKSAKSEKKSKAKAKDADSDVEDADLDAILAQYAEEQAKFLKVTEIPSEPPAPRSSPTVLASPSNRNELLLFGGEREFSSPKQGTFYHYNDFWHLDTATREWTRLETKGKSPPARSGHRMTYYKVNIFLFSTWPVLTLFKNYIILFGGFQDTSQQTKYLQDLWIYDCNKFTWFNPVLSAAAQKPDPRSSFSLLPHDTGAVIYGGYSRVKTTTGTGKQGKSGPQKMALRPMVHQDTWFLRITPPESESAAVSTGPAIRWERRKKPANTPNPARAGVTMAYHKGRGIMFGGVHDVELTEEGIESEFFDTLLAWTTDRNRFFPMSLRRPRAPGKKQQANQAAKGRDRSKATEEELLANLKALEEKGGIRYDDDDDNFMQSNVPKTEEPVESSKPAVVRFEMPHRRFNAQLAVQDDTLFIYGGTFEKGEREFTFDDMYSIDLVKLDGVKEIFYREPVNWNLLEEAEDSDEDMDDDEDDDEDMDEEEVDAMSLNTDSPTPTDVTVPSVTQGMEHLDVEEQESDEPEDSRPLPRPFESLREFFNRTSEDWQKLGIETLTMKGKVEGKTIKELRKFAFDIAEEKWWDSREEIMALEDEQEAAGIGEVVTLAERAENVGGAGRRR
ncbi:hypothetical protein N7526_007944 [Penicillium atrosanguineum]|nr:hypothetical protein N7526_007944 [Penicillium atrosanguineum]